MDIVDERAGVVYGKLETEIRLLKTRVFDLESQLDAVRAVVGCSCGIYVAPEVSDDLEEC